MKVLLVSANEETIGMLTLPLGAGCVAEATRRAGPEVEIVDLLAVGEMSNAGRGNLLTGSIPGGRAGIDSHGRGLRMRAPARAGSPAAGPRCVPT